MNSGTQEHATLRKYQAWVEPHQRWQSCRRSDRNPPAPGHPKYADDFGEPPPEAHGTYAATDLTSNQATGKLLDRGRSVSGFNHSPESSISGDSMNNHPENGTPPDSPAKAASPGATTTPHIGHLSLENQRQDSGVCVDTRPTPNAGLHSRSKRAASCELPRSDGNEHAQQSHTRNSQGSTAHVRQNNKPQKGLAKASKYRTRKKKSTDQQHQSPQLPPVLIEAHHRDQSCRTYKSSGASLQSQTSKSMSKGIGLPSDQTPSDIEWKTRPIQDNTDSRYPDLILQPKASPISPAQLAAEVKGIYSGLVTVEAKCINIDAAQSANPKSPLGPEQWQALIALHRTLLYEHHDFLMATQHPSANAALKGLALKYTMPARMWKHGIHAFLEVLRHRRPDSQDYMLAFIYLAYQMMALLYETVPAFVDTWIECLGDLARYRMAIEEDGEIHAIWGRAAADWYNMGSDRYPGTGRLYHHLGILERMRLKKYFFYAKALTTVYPFPSARESLATLCGPIVQDEQKFRAGYRLAEGRIMLFHAMLFMSVEDERLEDIAAESLLKLREDEFDRIREWGVSLVVVNIAALLEFGSPTNALWRWFGKTIYDEANSSSRPSPIAPHAFNLGGDNDYDILRETNSSSLRHVYRFTYMSFSAIIRLGTDRQSVRETLPSVHTMLVWVHALHKLQSRIPGGNNNDTVGSLIDSQRFDWVGLSNYLNTLVQHDPISARTIACAYQGSFLIPERAGDHKHLPEDFAIRGLVWTEFYFPTDWFDDRQLDLRSRAIETPVTHTIRAERVEWLGLIFAFHTHKEYLKFDRHTKSFHALVKSPPEFEQRTIPSAATTETQGQESSSPTSTRRSSTALSTHSDSDGYAVISSRTPTSPKPTIPPYASVVSEPKEERRKEWKHYDNVYPYIADDDDEYMQSVGG